MLDWIMTIPGILITCGVVLLFLAIVLFIIGNKKGKAAKVKLEANDQAAPETITNDTVATVTEPVAEVQPVVEETATPEAGVIDFTPTAEEPVAPIEPVTETAPVVEEVVSSEPAVELPTVEETAPAAEEPVAPAEPTVTIYGGNSPLENTQVEMPAVEATPYGGAPEVNVIGEAPAVEMPTVEPVVTPAEPTVEEPVIMPTPAVEPVTEIPTATPTPVVEPIVTPVETPAVEPAISQQPTIEIPEPTITTDNTNM